MKLTIKHPFKDGEYSKIVESATEEEIKELITDFCSDYWIQLATESIIRPLQGENFIDVTAEEMKESYRRLDCRIEATDEGGAILFSYPIIKYLNDSHYEDYLSMGEGDLIHCEVWASQLEKFIDASKWHFGLKMPDGSICLDRAIWPSPQMGADGLYHWVKASEEWNPIIWFGVKGEAPLNTWILDEEGIEALVAQDDAIESGVTCGYPYSDDYPISLNYDILFDCRTFWYFDECGNDGPDFTHIIKSIPISPDTFETKEFAKAVNNAVYNYQFLTEC